MLLSGQKDARAQHATVQKYTIEDGLVNNDILNIYQDSRGFIWLCTRGGLSCYDGSRFTNYTTDNGLTNDMINAIVETARQEFIVAQNSEGPRRLKNGRMEPLSQSGNMIINKFYKSTDASLVAVTDYDGVVVWNKNKFNRVNPAYTAGISRMSKLNDSVWLLLKQGKSIQLMTTSLQPRSVETVIAATSVFTDSRQQTWVGTTGGLRLLDPVTKPGKAIGFLPLPPPFDLPILRESYISDLFEDRRGNYWVGTINGLVKIDNRGESGIYTRENGLPVSTVNCIMEDRENNMWIGTVQGLAKISLNNELRTIATNFGFSGSVTAAIIPITENRLRLFNGKNISELDMENGTLKNSRLINSPGYLAYKTGQKELLIIKDEKAMLFQAGQEEYERINWPAFPFYTVINISPQFYLGTNGNTLYSIANGKVIKKLTTPTDGWIQCMAFDKKNSLWLGNWQNGLFKIRIQKDGDSLKLEIADTISKRLPDQHIRAMYTDRENELWVGTRYKGLIRIVELPGGIYEVQTFGTNEGLSSNFVTTINRDPVGNIWVGSSQGLDKLIPEKNKYRVFNFGKVNKVFSNILEIHFLNNKRLLAASYHSLISAKDMLQDTLPPPPVYITKVSAGPSDSSFSLNTTPVSLPNRKAQIYFEFSSPQFINEDFTKYSYRLLGGNDSSWNIAARSHSVSFASLRPGIYTFEIRALGFNGKWGEPARYDFIVNPPFWQKAWFVGLMIAALGFLIYAVYRYRVQQLIRLQKVRNHIAADLHDEIGSSLTNISILSNLSKKSLTGDVNTKDFLQRISEEVSSSSQALDDIIWSVNTSHDTLEETVARMRRYAAELFDAAGISYELHLDPSFERTKLAMEQRRDIYLLYKEAVNNISKHAQAKQVNINIAIVHGRLQLHIADDGKGFEAGKESHRHGLQGMKQRVEKWKGQISIDSGNGKGTSIRIQLPV